MSSVKAVQTAITNASCAFFVILWNNRIHIWKQSKCIVLYGINYLWEFSVIYKDIFDAVAYGYRVMNLNAFCVYYSD